MPVYSNVSAQPFPSDPAAMRALLGRQLCEPVMWEASLKGLVAAGELGGTAGSHGATARLWQAENRCCAETTACWQ